MQMKPLSFLAIGLILVSFYSCSKEFGTTEITYIKAEAIYKPVSEFRINEFNAPVRNVDEKGKLYVGDNYLLLGELDEGIHVFDNTDPENPEKINFIQIPGNYDFFIEDDQLYANSYFDLVKFDISDPGNVRLIARHASGLIEDQSIKFNADNVESELIGFEFRQVTEEVEPNTNIWQYLNEGEETIYYDYRDEVIPPSSVPGAFVGNSSGQTGTTNRLAVHEDKLYVLMRNRIDVFDANLRRGSSQEIQAFGALETLYEFNGTLYLGTETSMIVYQIFGDQLLNKGRFTHARACDPVLPVSDEIAYVTTRSGGNCPGDENRLYVVQTDISNSRYTLLQEFTLRQPYGMAMVDGKLFVAESERGMTVMNASNPSRLSSIGSWSARTVEDVLPHPTQQDVLLISTGDRLIHLKVADQTNQFRVLSEISL